MTMDKRTINHSHKKHYPIKATKSELLKYIKKKEIITAMDLVDHFGYKPESAKAKLRSLRQKGLVTSWVSPGQWCLTQQGEKRYQYYIRKEEQENNQ